MKINITFEISDEARRGISLVEADEIQLATYSECKEKIRQLVSAYTEIWEEESKKFN